MRVSGLGPGQALEDDSDSKHESVDQWHTDRHGLIMAMEPSVITAARSDDSNSDFQRTTASRNLTVT